MSRKKISGCVNATCQYRKKEKMFPKNSLSLDIDNFRSKGWMSIEIPGCFLTGRQSDSKQRQNKLSRLCAFHPEFNKLIRLAIMHISI